MEANKRQEGGDHYQKLGERQHWDLVIEYDWDYFQAQVTKYLMRWKTKHKTTEKRLEDLAKARHFLDKYIENYKAFELPEPDPRKEMLLVGAAHDGDDKYSCEGYFGDMTQLYKCRNCRSYHREASLEAMHRRHDGQCLVVQVG